MVLQDFIGSPGDVAERVRVELRRRRLALNSPLAAEQFKAKLAVSPMRYAVTRGERMQLNVSIVNNGPVPLNSYGTHPVTVRGRWLGRDKQPLAEPEAIADLAAPLRGGRDDVIKLQTCAPDFVGNLFFEIGLAQEGGLDFVASGNAPVVVEVEVNARAVDDIDYHAIYATPDLETDYWNVVGPSSKEEYDRLVEGKARHLLEEKISPNARVLDVGCGTGVTTIACERHLSPEGSYFGTDIAAEAVAFCKKRFPHPNFRFAQNGMTTIPIQNEVFDYICFYSVFTHTYAEETALLLGESSRLLAPGGVLFADVFTSPQVERAMGNRLTLVLRENYFQELAALSGLSCEQVYAFDWTPHVQRRVFRCRHRAN